ncbi:MAG TPA: hypothetical protein VJB89_00015 [Candidatus Nanoarchaeia archaeon]|nr:hypothetical protein [Candidatus Nanoarchaeia archaeon]
MIQPSEVLKDFKKKKFRKELFLGFIGLIGLVLLWRGIWNLTDKYFLPNNFLISNIIGITIGLFLLLAFGVAIDLMLNK